MLTKIKSWCRHSWTVAWAYLKAFVGIVIAVAPLLKDKLNDPNITAILPPAWVGYGLFAVAVVTFVARVVPHVRDNA